MLGAVQRLGQQNTVVTIVAIIEVKFHAFVICSSSKPSQSTPSPSLRGNVVGLVLQWAKLNRETPLGVTSLRPVCLASQVRGWSEVGCQPTHPTGGDRWRCFFSISRE